jgi:hypothetical protein
MVLRRLALFTVTNLLAVNFDADFIINHLRLSYHKITCIARGNF